MEFFLKSNNQLKTIGKNFILTIETFEGKSIFQ